MAAKNWDGPHADLTERIIGAAMRVHNELKPGLDEKLYENALAIELRNKDCDLKNSALSPSTTKVI